MADKQCVSVKCEVKEIFDSGLKGAVLEAMTDTITSAINNKSSGKLIVKTSGDGFILTAGLVLKADDKDKPAKLDAKISLMVVSAGSTLKAFTGTANGSMDGPGPKIDAAAKDLITQILQPYMPKVIKAILGL